MIINDRMRVMIHDRASEQELERQAREVTPGIRDDGRAKGARRQHLARGTAPRHARRVMAAFEYTALDAQGRELRGVLEGDSARQIRQLLREQALLPVTVTEVSDAPTRKSFSFSLRQPHPDRDLALLTRQLSTLVRSGIPLEEALLAVSQQSEKARVRSVVAACGHA